MTIDAVSLDWYTDAAKGANLGFGGCYGRHWFFGQWEKDYISRNDPSIEYLELYAVCVSVFLWTKYIKNKRIILYCDNQSVVTMINNTTARCRNCMHLIRMMTSRSLNFNCRIFTRWVRGKSNIHADLLSRQKITQFKVFTAGSEVNELPEELPAELWPATKLWLR